MNLILVREALEVSETLCQKISALMLCENEGVKNLFENYWWDVFTIQGHIQEMTKLLGKT